MFFIIQESSEGHSYCLPALGRNAARWHPEHWAKITLLQQPLRPSQCFVLIRKLDSSVPYQFWADRWMAAEENIRSPLRANTGKTVPWMATTRDQVHYANASPLQLAQVWHISRNPLPHQARIELLKKHVKYEFFFFSVNKIIFILPIPLT